MKRLHTRPPISRARLLLLICWLLAALLLPALAGRSAAQTNLALGKPALASSIEGAGFEAARAVDGSTSTRWASVEGGTANQWLQIDLQVVSSISRVVLSWEAAYAAGYRLEVSNDAASWTPIYTTSSGDGGVDDLALSAQARYIRIYCTLRGNAAWGFSLWEVQVYGSGGSLPTATRTSTSISTPTRTSTSTASGNLALNKPALSSSNENTSLTPNLAVDGNAGTRWASLYGDPQWIRIDLGSTYAINRVVLRWEAAYGRAYQVELSSDGTSWNTIYTTSSGDGGVDDLTGLSGSGRYLRVYGSARGTQWGYSLWELEAYGSEGPAPTATRTSTGTQPTATRTRTNTGAPPSPTRTRTNTPTTGGWNLVWSDEFNGTSINSSNWTFIVSGEGGGNNERQYYTNGQNASIVADATAEDSRALLIEARRENPAGYQCWYGSCQYTSARMVTQGKRSWQYGRIEARMRLPYGNGLWPAFWMMGNSGSWPASGEIDIMELVGGTQCGSECGDNHTHGYMWWYDNGERSDGAQGINLPSGKYSDAYHVFGVEWDSQQIRWTVDGQPLLRADNGQPLVLSITGSAKTEFHQPFYILMNIAVGGAWPLDPPASTVFPQRMYVDWVRVYQR